MTTPTPEQFLGMPSTADDEDEPLPESASAPHGVVEPWIIGAPEGNRAWAGVGQRPVDRFTVQDPHPMTQASLTDYVAQIAADVRRLAAASGIGAKDGARDYAEPLPGSAADLSTPSFERVTNVDFAVQDDIPTVSIKVPDSYIEQVQLATEQVADAEAKIQTLIELVDEIKAIVKPSSSKVSLEVKAAIERWANPVVEEPVTPQEDPGEGTNAGDSSEAEIGPGHTRVTPEQGPDVCHECSVAAVDYVQWPCPVVQAKEAAEVPGPTVVVEHTDPVQPQPTDHVEAWRRYAREVQPDAKWEGMNRSQIRTALGLSHPSEQ